MTSPSIDITSPPRDEDEALARLRSLGGRITQSRRALVHHFYSHDTGVTVEELLEHLPVFDPATLYRAVNALEAAGIVEHTHLGHGAATYKRAGIRSVSLVCQRCGHILDVPRKQFEPIAAEVRAQHGFDVDLRHFAITGTCRECSAS